MYNIGYLLVKYYTGNRVILIMHYIGNRVPFSNALYRELGAFQ
jgi:hypothetical protein